MNVCGRKVIVCEWQLRIFATIDENIAHINMHKLYAFRCVVWCIVLVPSFVLKVMLLSSLYNVRLNSDSQNEPGIGSKIFEWLFGSRKNGVFFGSVPASRTSTTNSFDMCEIIITRFIGWLRRSRKKSHVKSIDVTRVM